MAADSSVFKPRSGDSKPSETTIAIGILGSWGHEAETCDISLENVIIEKVAKLAKQYAAGPPEQEFKALKDRLGAISREVGAKDGGAALVPNGPTGEEARLSNPTRDRDVGRDECIERAQDGSDFSARIRAMEASIRVSAGPSRCKNGHFASSRPSIGKLVRTSAYLFIAALLGVGARVAWDYGGDDAKEMAGAWSSSLSWPSFISNKNKRPAPVKAAAATPPEVALRLDPVRPGYAARRDSSEQLGAKKELMSHSAPTTLHRIEQEIRPKISSPPLDHSQLTPTPEARPATLEGWMVDEVSDGVAVLQGPNGIWRAKRGDAVPGLGKVEFIVRWGNYWIVATSRGLISTP